jgi:hypothetical protein
MKNSTLWILIIFVLTSCAGQKNTDLSSATIEYEAHSRGFYQKIVVKNQRVIVSKNKEEKPISIIILNDQWKELITELKNNTLEEIPSLKAPTQKRLYDGAAIANLRITHDGKTYETPSFDHGNPHDKIKKLVQKLRSFIKEK